ncbi:hypothetical protein FHX69_1847 [Prauserella muralis]|nr:hypothetical protein FHX69_1847 [Prauserella muralis]
MVDGRTLELSPIGLPPRNRFSGRSTDHAGRGRARPDRFVLDASALVPVARSPHRSLVPRVWQLRHAIPPYDAAYVALAGEQGVPLVTSRARQAGAAPARRRR